MDEMKIKTPFTKNFIAGAIRKLIKSKTGYDVSVNFLDDILIQADDNGVYVRVNAEGRMTKDSLSDIRRKLIGF